MKKKIFTLALALFTSMGAFAQLQAGSIAPNFNLKDLNGTSYDLYTLLNSGKTVFIDVSAAWCAPCWAYHNSGALENLYKLHGPTGAPNVNASTTNDVMVLMVEGESTNTRAQLYGTTSGTGHATFSQGDWVTGTPYPIIDTNSATTTAFNTAWNIGYFPTVYMVCRDHLVQEVGQLTTAALYAKATGVCPTYAPSSTVDAKAIPYSSSSFFVCNATPTVKFQNYSQTQTITSATIKVYSGTTLVTTYAWTGSVAPYGIANVTIPGFTPSQFAPYKYDVTVTGDTYAANNTSLDSLFKVYSSSNAVATPWSENFEAQTGFPYRMSDGSGGYLFPFKANSDGSLPVTGSNGLPSRAVCVDFPNMTLGKVSELVLGNFNCSSATNVAIDFDYAYGQMTAADNDKFEIKVSKDCGATWSTAWSKSGTDLATGTPSNSAAFVPTAASMWRHASALLTPYKSNNMVVKFVATDNGGNYGWFDNAKITNTLAVSNVITAGSVTLYPNPAKESATLEFTLSNSSKVNVSVLDALGRTVSVVADAQMQQGLQHISIPTAALAAGVYNITIRTEEGSQTQRLSVVK